MPPPEPSSAFTPAVGAVLLDEFDRVLLVLRGHEPDMGRWSLPGGRVEPGETATEAVIREMSEETGLSVHVVRHVAQVRRPRIDGGTYVIDDFLVAVDDGTLRAGDDAADVAWFSPAEIVALDVTLGLVESLREWGFVPTNPAA